MRRILICICLSLIFLSGCNGLDMKSVHYEPNFAGVVTEVFDNSILVSVNEGEAVRSSSDLVFVSLDVYLSDSMTDFMSGDEVVVFFDGTTLETYPAQINTVYAILLTSPSKKGVWHDTVEIEISHTQDGHTSAWAFGERSRIDELMYWFTRLTLTRVLPQDSENLNIEAFAEVYEFVMTTSLHFSWDEENEFTVHDNGEIFVFHYGRIGGAWYLLFGGVWYEVKNPTNIIFPVKHEPVIFEPVEIPEPNGDVSGTAVGDLAFTLEEWTGSADTAFELIYEDDDYRYYLSSIRSHLIMLNFQDGQRLTLADAITQIKVSIDELKQSGLGLLAVSKHDSTERHINRAWANGSLGDAEGLVDLGCCVSNVMVQSSAVIGANSVTQATENFIMTLNADRKIYTTEDVIKIWGTLEYIGDSDSIEIWHGCPFMLFTISDGNDFNIGGMTVDILASSVLQRGRVYHFEHQKSGGWSADAPDAAFWENFFSEHDLRLPAGEYTITLHGGFGLSERISDNPSGLRASLTILVTP